METTSSIHQNPYQDVSSPTLVNSRLADQQGDFPTNHTPTQYTEQPLLLELSDYGLGELGLRNLGHVYRNLAIPILVEHSIARTEGILSANGALCVKTGKYTGRSPHDKYMVDEAESREEIHWSQMNVPIPEFNFDRLCRRVRSYVQGRDLYIFDGYVGADPQYRYGVRVITERASQSLFAQQLFIRPTPEQLKTHHADFTVIAVPGLHADPEDDGINSEAFIVLNLSKKMVIIGGSKYAGEIKKSVFSLMNYFMTKADVLPMHCAANMDADGNTALFFGLSGTGKTTLSADPHRYLIGDDEHGWSDHGVFNFEGGCYAKTIKLRREQEPQIWDAIRFGALMENVVLDHDTRIPDFDDSSLTENTRVAYPIEYIPNAVIPGVGRHPKTIIFLTADAFGVLPPIAKLTALQAMYHFMSGYTSKVAGTERGIKDPEATFSAGFGKCFLPLAASVYAKLLGKRLEEHPETKVYLVNTGWSGGPYGVGERVAIAHTRAMVSAAVNGDLDSVKFNPHPIFKVLVPETIPGVPDEILDPIKTWKDPQEYEKQAKQLAQLFVGNFQKFEGVPESVLEAQPNIN
ncbi:phosphoenolpyruvate carboxykinase (ATP) [Planktothrix paucivesiculata]|uniref:Phosphoenolpyruvate carboxykinase (ATP) n=1 Tax=Planktothrix paucivesiculata PCC 9631 TaxID=671071 RepID=A0A7Z9E196_9CYAN|nr:phosphoenolpyruvate carboxykinase (ATP) [Planktothrix paucivesiculata]VXD17757.1 Phosphoenolpyruvate carboxykinase (ATP) (PEP carboxykinase) (Phosphoenolpyruvate carboxylase) (PEPCK) [Planktothrix paucivesiculata PCC 9631]